MFLGVLIIAGFMILTACNSFGSNTEIIRGEGPMVARTFDVAEFDALDISGFCMLIFRQADEVSVELYMQENLFEHHEVVVRNGVLSFGAVSGTSIEYGSHTPRLYVFAPQLTSVDISGTVTTEDWDVIDSQSFALNISGVATVDIELEVGSLGLDLSGVANLRLTGRAVTVNVDATGVGDVKAFGLMAQNAVINSSGVGNIDMAVTDTLDVRVSGIGSVRYMGDPIVTPNVSGMGTLSRHDS